MDTQKINILSLSKQDTLVMKGIAICAMLFHHMYGCPPAWVEPYSGVLEWFGELGKVCVALFLFCSGYGLSSNYSPISFKEDLKFIGRRLIKFYLNYWVIFLIFVPITVFAFHRPLSVAYGEHVNIFKHLVYDLLGVKGDYSYNITWWFNKLIIVLYLLFPLLCRAIRIIPWLALIFSMVLIRCSIYIHIPYDDVGICTWQFPFVLGIVWKLYEEKGEKVQEWLVVHRWVAALGTLCLLIALVKLRMYPIIPYWRGIRMDGFLSCAIVLFVITILRNSKSLMTMFAFLGKHSMNIYLMHTFFNDFWHLSWLHGCEWLRGGANFILLMSMCLSVSILLEYVKEKLGFYKFIKHIITHNT